MKSPLILIGAGTAGSAVIRNLIQTANLPTARFLAIDTDAASGIPFSEAGDSRTFHLIGGNRLAGRSTGGDTAAAREAFIDEPTLLDEALEGVRLAIVTTCLGGGAGNGLTAELLKHLRHLGIPSLLIATTPFQFEGEKRVASARTAEAIVRQYADVSVILPLDHLVQNAQEATLSTALSQALETLSSGLTLFQQLLEKPGYIRLETERLRHALLHVGTARFAVASASGPNRVATILNAFSTSPLLVPAQPAQKILLGVLAGDDLRLCELDELSREIQARFGSAATTLDLGTVNDEATFAGRLQVVLLAFDGTLRADRAQPKVTGGGLASADRFAGTDRTERDGVNLDEPTYLRLGITLER